MVSLTVPLMVIMTVSRMVSVSATQMVLRMVLMTV
jgi:hypothetical protein